MQAASKVLRTLIEFHMLHSVCIQIVSVVKVCVKIYFCGYASFKGQ